MFAWLIGIAALGFGVGVLSSGMRFRSNRDDLIAWVLLITLLVVLVFTIALASIQFVPVS